MTYKFPPMLGPYDDWPEGFDRAMRVSNALQLEVIYAKQNGVEGFVEFVSGQLLREKPWLYFPDENRPSPIGEYFRIVTGLELPDVLAMMRAYGRDDVANRLEGDRARHDATAINLGGGGGNNPTGANQHKAREVTHDTIMSDQKAKPAQGTSVAYTLRRLARERPDLLARVEAGELSANKAAIEAGFRKVPTPQEQIRKAFAKLTDDERVAMLAELAQQ
jgi:hypothetical protein